jgi:hypothetical protein
MKRLGISPRVPDVARCSFTSTQQSARCVLRWRMQQKTRNVEDCPYGKLGLPGPHPAPAVPNGQHNSELPPRAQTSLPWDSAGGGVKHWSPGLPPCPATWNRNRLHPPTGVRGTAGDYCKSLPFGQYSGTHRTCYLLCDMCSASPGEHYNPRRRSRVRLDKSVPGVAAIEFRTHCGPRSRRARPLAQPSYPEPTM